MGQILWPSQNNQTLSGKMQNKCHQTKSCQNAPFCAGGGSLHHDEKGVSGLLLHTRKTFTVK